MMAFVVAVDARDAARGRRRGGCAGGSLYALASCAAVYTHYTLRLRAGRAARVAPVGPPGGAQAGAASRTPPRPSALPAVDHGRSSNDLNSPTTKILDALQPFDLHDVAPRARRTGRSATRTATVAAPARPARHAGAGAAGAGRGRRAGRRSRSAADAALRGRACRAEPPAWCCVVVLALATPVGEALAAPWAPTLFGTRNLAASWPGLALAVAALLAPGRPAPALSSPPRWRSPPSRSAR